MNHFKKNFNQLLNQPVVERDDETIYFYTSEPKIEKPQQEVKLIILRTIKHRGKTI